MAVIDTFLKMVVAQRAETLVLVPEEVPSVIKENQATDLPMPAVPADLAERLCKEVAGREFSGSPSEGTYCTADGEEFAYRISSSGSGSSCRIEMHSLAESEAAEDEASLPDALAHPPTAAAPPPSPPLGIVAPPRAPPGGKPGSDILGALDQANQRDASDIFLSSGKPAQMRLRGTVRALTTNAITSEQIEELLPDADHLHLLTTSGSVDFGVRWEIAGKSRRYRLNIFRHSHGLAAAIRPIRDRIPPLNELHLPADLTDLTAFPSGLVLVTGASGSGKSTTLAALVEHVNQTRASHIITIEDPIEFEHQEGKSLIHQREVGASVESFSSGLRAALRENPDVILLGEMRDLATISAALTAAETGHLVLSTLHTGAASAAISRIVDVFPGHQQPHIRLQLASSLRAVISQRLLPASDGTNLVPAIERMIVTPAIANSIRDGHEHHMRSSMQTGVEDGMITLERSLASLECRGLISRETALRYAHDREVLQKLIE